MGLSKPSSARKRAAVFSAEPTLPPVAMPSIIRATTSPGTMRIRPKTMADTTSTTGTIDAIRVRTYRATARALLYLFMRAHAM